MAISQIIRNLFYYRGTIAGVVADRNLFFLSEDKSNKKNVRIVFGVGRITIF